MTYKETSVLISVAVFALVFGTYLLAARGKGHHKTDRAPLFRRREPDDLAPLPPYPPLTAPAGPLTRFPGDEPAFLPAPVPQPARVPDYVLAAIGHGGDSQACVESMWNRVQARQLRELLRAEEAEEALS